MAASARCPVLAARRCCPRCSGCCVPILVVTVLITGLNLVTSDASTGAQLFYLWPVLYAANFLGRRAIYLNLLLVCAGDGRASSRPGRRPGDRGLGRDDRWP